MHLPNRWMVLDILVTSLFTFLGAWTMLVWVKMWHWPLNPFGITAGVIVAVFALSSVVSSRSVWILKNAILPFFAGAFLISFNFVPTVDAVVMTMFAITAAVVAAVVLILGTYFAIWITHRIAG